MSYAIQPNPKTQVPELVINGWEQGIGASPESGVNVKNANIESVTGTVRPNWRSNLSSIAQFTLTFTASSVNNEITLSGTGATTINFNLQAVQVSNSGGALPSGLSASTTYYMSIVGGFGSGTYYLSTTLSNAKAGVPITLVSNGTGTQSVFNTASATVMGTITYMLNVPVVVAGVAGFYQFAYDNAGHLWFLNQSPSTWSLVAGNTLTNNSGNGFQFFIATAAPNSDPVTWLFCVGNNFMDALNVSTFISSYAPTWVLNASWGTPPTFNSPAGFIGSHYALYGQDNKVYICDGRHIDSFSEVIGKVFSPTDNTTYTFNNAALLLPAFAGAQCLEELGQNLLVGDLNSNYVYPWDRVSTSFTLPMRCAENNIWRMKNVDNTVYIIAGTKGNIYQTTGYSIVKEMKIPEYLSGGVITQWGGMDKVSGALIFGLNPTTTSNAGVYKLYTSGGQYAGAIVGSIIIDQTPSVGATLPTAVLAPVGPVTEFYYTGYAGGIDVLDSSNKYQNFESYVESDIIPVGTFLQPGTFDQIEYKLDYAPTAGSIRLSWRSDLSQSYTYINTSSGTSVAGIISMNFPSNIAITQWVQIKAEITGGTGFNCPRLRELRLTY